MNLLADNRLNMSDSFNVPTNSPLLQEKLNPNIKL